MTHIHPSPEALADLRHLWSATRMHRADIATVLNERHGIGITGNKVAGHAKAHGIHRDAGDSLPRTPTATPEPPPQAVVSPGPRGQPPTLSEAVLAFLERLWSQTVLSQAAIVAELALHHGMTMEPAKLEWHARRRAWTRDLMARNHNHPQMREQKLALKSVHRWANGARREDNAVRLVASGTHATGPKGFRIGGVP